MADGYASAVVAGRVDENDFVVRACRRYLDMRQRAESGDAEFHWSGAHVVEVCAFVEECPQGAGGADADSTLSLEPCQCWWIAAIFGFRFWFGGRSVRWVNDVFIDEARKNGKSALFARIDVYLFLYEGEQVSEIYLAASTREQAKKVYGPILNVLKAAPELVSEHGLKVTAKETRKPDGGLITTISANAKKEDGHNPHVAHIDEVHATPSPLVRVMESAMGARINQILIKTTTAGVFAHGAAYDERKRAERVLRGQEKADRYFAVIYTVPTEILEEPLTWRNVVLANPMIDAIPPLAAKIRDDMEAARFDPKKRAEFLTKRLNVYSQSAEHAITPEQWAACADRTLRIEDFAGQKAWLGADLSAHDDMTAIVAVLERGPDLVVFAWHFIPSEAPIMSDEEMAPTLRDWIAGGWITVTDGPLINHAQVQALVEQVWGFLDVEYGVWDMAQSVQMVAALQNKGMKAGAIRSTPAEVNEATRDLVTRARHGRLKHNGNPVLAWNAVNTCLRAGDLWKPIKEKTMPNLKIDGISAAVHANTARLGRVSVRMPDVPPPFDPNRIIRSV